jgi:hypothetical protein
MSRTVYLVGFVALLAAVATAGYLLFGGGSDAATVGSLAGRIRAQTEATRAAVALATDIWVPRIAGLGLGLAGGLLAGGVGAYVKWGDGR